MTGEGRSASDLAEAVVRILTPLLGPHTARHALGVVGQKLSCAPEQLTAAHADPVTQVLTPMLRTLLGAAAAERVRQRILEEGGGS